MNSVLKYLNCLLKLVLLVCSNCCCFFLKKGYIDKKESNYYNCSFILDVLRIEIKRL